MIPNVAAHPIGAFLDRELLLSVNSDDPVMFHNPLWLEFYTLHKELNFTRNEILSLTLSAVQTSWLEADAKEELKKAIIEVRDDLPQMS